MSAKKTEDAIVPAEEVVSTPTVEGPILPQATASNLSDLIPPRMSIVQGTSASIIRKGGKPGNFFLDLPEGMGGVKVVDNVRVHLVDGNLPARVMFPYDTVTGEPVMGGENKPWCGSSDGETPRRTFWGKQYTDYRNGFLITINEWLADPFTKQVRATSGCAECPLGSWRPSLRDRQTGEYLLDEKTGKKRSAKPPCQESPSFVLWLPDFETPILFQATSFSIRAAMMGHKPTNKPGIGFYYSKPQKQLKDGRWTTMTWDGQNYYPLIMSIVYESNAYGGTYVPTFEVSKEPFTAEELLKINGDPDQGIPSIYALYQTPGEGGFSTRDVLSGKAWSGDTDSSDDYFSLPEGQETPAADTELARRLLGGPQGEDRRIGGEASGPF